MRAMKVRTAIALMTLGLATSAARADVISDNLNGGNYYTGGGYFSENNVRGDSFETAQDFSLAHTYTLDTIKVPLATFGQPTNSVTLRLWSSSNGLPASVLESWTVNGQMGTSAYNLVTFNSVLHPLLATGGQYFVDVLAPNPGQLLYYPGSSLFETRTLVHSFDLGQTWSLRYNQPTTGYMAFRVEGTLATAVPEPSVPGLLGVAGLALTAAKLRRRGRA